MNYITRRAILFGLIGGVAEFMWNILVSPWWVCVDWIQACV